MATTSSLPIVIGLIYKATPEMQVRMVNTIRRRIIDISEDGNEIQYEYWSICPVHKVRLTSSLTTITTLVNFIKDTILAEGEQSN